MENRLESAITADILKALRKAGAWAEKVHGGPMQSRGLPDIVGGYRGRLIGLEVKRPGLDATPIQQHKLGKIATAGGYADVVHSVEEALKVIEVIDADLE
jgi:Holliday junction resolvase